MTRLIRTLPGHHVLAVQRVRNRPVACHARQGGAAAHESVVHDHASLALCISGSAVLWAGASYKIEAGTVFLIPEGQPHYMTELSELEFMGMALCPHCTRPPWSAPLLEIFERVHLGQSVAHHVSPPDMHAMVETMERLADLFDRVGPQGHTPHTRLHEDGLMCVLTAQLGAALEQSVPSASTSNQTTLTARALGYIQQHATQPISLVDVSSAVGRHPSHVATIVKEESGRTVGAWITHARMSHARQLLLASQDNIEIISEQVGFASASHFHRTFKTWHGVSPGKWRKQHEQA